MGAGRTALDLNVASQKQANKYGGSCGNGIGLSGQSKRLEYDGRSYSSFLKNDGHSIGHLKHAHSGLSSLDTHGLSEENGPSDTKDNEEALEHTREISSLPTVDQFNSTWESSCIRSGLNGQINSSEDFIDESGQFDEQFECLKQQMEDLYTSVATEDNSCLPQSVLFKSLSTACAVWEGRYLETRASEGNTSRPDKYEIENSCLPEADLLSNVKLPDVHFIVNKQEVSKLKLKQLKQEQKISSLEKELVESRKEIKNLKQQLKTSECISFQETNLVKESESSVDESLLIIGGYYGFSYVSALEYYCPSHDLLESLCPISSIRSCSSTVKMNGEVYVIGGLHDNLWCDTVESYNLEENQWVTRPSLNQKKGSLAGISLNEKNFRYRRWQWSTMFFRG